MNITDLHPQGLDDLAAYLDAFPDDRQEATIDMLNEADADDTAPKNLLDTDPELATVPLAELQTRYGTNVKTLRTHIAEGKLRAIKVGKGYRVTVAAVRDWLKLHEVQPGSEE